MESRYQSRRKDRRTKSGEKNRISGGKKPQTNSAKPNQKEATANQTKPNQTKKETQRKLQQGSMANVERVETREVDNWWGEGKAAE